MKKLFCSLFILLISSSGFSDTNFKEPEENTPKVNSLNYTHFKRKEIAKDEMFLDMKNKLSYGYFKVGANPFIQNIGVGKRSYVNSTTSLDVSGNLYVSALALYDNKYVFMPSFKFSSLKYINRKESKSYSGVGYELGVYTDISHHRFIPIPNIEFIWGKERESIKFSQLSLNLTPLVAGVAVTTFEYAFGGRANDNILAYLALTGAAALTYTVGF